MRECLPTPLERAGTWPSRAGPYFFEEIGERTPRGRRFLPLGTPFSGGRNGGRWLVRYGPGLRPPRPTPHGPPTSSGGREKWSVDRRRKRETKRLLSSFSQRVPTHVPSPPSRGAGRYQRSNERAAGQVSRKRYSLPPHNPTREGSPEGRTSSLWGSFPHFFPRNGAPAGQAKVPCRSNGVRKNPQWAPPGRAPFPPVPTAQGKNPTPPPSQTAMGFKALQSAPSAHPAAPPGAPAAPLPHGGTGFPSHSPRQCPRRRRRPPRGRSPGTPSPPR